MDIPNFDKLAQVLNNIPLEFRQRMAKELTDDLGKLEEMHEQLRKATIPTQELLDTRMNI